MSMLNEMQEAVSEAKRTLESADYVARRMATLLEGRLRKADSWTLQRLKAELCEFNARTGEWKS